MDYDIFWAILLGLLIIVIGGLFIGFFVMLLWNWLMPILFGLKTITYLQGWGIAVLCGLLFKNSYGKLEVD